MSISSGKDKKPDYKFFELFYYAGKRWGREHLKELTELCFGKKADARAFEQRAREAFKQSKLGNSLSTKTTRPKFRSDAEIAESRFIAGALDVVTEEATSHGLAR